MSTTTPDILEGNEKIDRFMGHLVRRIYHNDWRELVPVVQKIDALWMQYDIGDWRNDTDQYKYLDVISLPIGTPIMEVWEKVVKFIDWYSQQNAEK
jgi:hypothetical protein